MRKLKRIGKSSEIPMGLEVSWGNSCILMLFKFSVTFTKRLICNYTVL